VSFDWLKRGRYFLFILVWFSWVGQADARALAVDVVLLDGEIEATELTTHLGESVGFVIIVQNSGEADAEGVFLHVTLPDSVNFLIQNQGWLTRINSNNSYTYLKPIGPLSANTSQEIILILQVKADLHESITSIPTPLIKITADDAQPFQLDMGAGDDVIVINEVAALGDSTRMPTGLPTVQEPMRAVQELRIYLPLIY